MSGGRIDKLCRAVLPPGYERVRREAPAIQHFLEHNLPEPVNRAVTLLTLDDNEIVIAANNPLVANYLRLHQAELRQQLRETFDLQQALRIRTLPDSMLQPGQGATTRTPQRVGAEAIHALERNADWIEDDELRAALQSLADSLKRE